jgi:hypothetical protein
MPTTAVIAAMPIAMPSASVDASVRLAATADG